MRRTLISLLALPLGLALADWGVGRYLGGLEEAPPLPPFGSLPEELRPEYEAGLLRARRAKGGPRVNRFDAELGWTNVPGTTVDSSTTINSLGARGASEYEPAPAPDTLRLVCYGPSFVYCSEVGDEQAWPRQMELQDSGVEAINMGVGGYGTDQALLRFRRHGLLGAQVALLGLCLEDICRNVNRYRAVYVPNDFGAYAKPRFLLDESGQLELLPQPFASRAELLEAVLDGSIVETLRPHEYWSEPVPLQWSTTMSILAARDAHQRRVDRFRLWLDLEGEPYRLTLALVHSFLREARAAGAERCLLVIFGLRHDIGLYRTYREKYWEPLLKTLAAAGIDVFDANDLIYRMGLPLPYKRAHYDERANALLATALLRHLGR